MAKPIFTSLSPNVESDDVSLSLSLLLQPWRWKWGRGKKKLADALQDFFSVKKVFLFESGRTSLYAIIKSLGLKKGDEILIQAYTCVAVPDPILWAGAKPIYVDCDKNFNMSVTDLKKKITPRTKALVMQHTFGMPADILEILEVAKKHKLFVIEDLAHSLGSTYKNEYVGTFGDAAFLSFGRDKVISSVFGGAALTNNKDLSEKLQAFHSALWYPSLIWIKRQLLHPPITAFAKLTYRIFIGKVILFCVRKFHILSRAVYKKEKRGKRPRFVMKKMPNALCVLALHQFEKLFRFNQHRKLIAELYNLKLQNSSFTVPQKNPEKESMYLRYTILSKDSQKILQDAKKQKIFLGDWYTTPIAPAGVDYKAVCFSEKGMLAKSLAEQSLNLPTSIGITKKDALRITEFLENYK